LDKDTKGIAQDLAAAEGRLASYLEEKKQRLGSFFDELDLLSATDQLDETETSRDERGRSGNRIDDQEKESSSESVAAQTQNVKRRGKEKKTK
jgi:hypothetical protein